VFDAARSFRLRLNAYITGLSKKKSKDDVIEKPTHGTIWYAKKYPQWQTTIMDHMSEAAKANETLPENKVLAAELAKIPELKKYQKKVMPFVQTIKERVVLLGVERGLAQSLEFSEFEALNLNLSYLANNLDVSSNLSG